ncbi:hypothetical protein AYI69_g6246 [Smittium culicis]|uniref:Uncharacterized protein n=1 Tax=Smittium culicis TaxID=133412 RepID=A0A1R1Y088_9FUNG|nr:hypothetical protein AYI69_g6246 [Smittium culicis]
MMNYKNILCYASYLVLASSEEFKNGDSGLKIQINKSINTESSILANSQSIEYKQASKNLNIRQDIEFIPGNANKAVEWVTHSDGVVHQHTVDHDEHDHSDHTDHDNHEHSDDPSKTVVWVTHSDGVVHQHTVDVDGHNHSDHDEHDHSDSDHSDHDHSDHDHSDNDHSDHDDHEGHDHGDNDTSNATLNTNTSSGIKNAAAYFSVIMLGSVTALIISI